MSNHRQYQIMPSSSLSYHQFNTHAANSLYTNATGQATVYLRELCVPVSSLPGRWSLRSAEQGDLVVPRVRLATAQHRSFAVVGPSFWNALPSRLRSELLALSLPLFRSRLKTILFDHGLVLLGRECL